jgi:asparagine synthase (glutamine-hydrolysing)
LHLYEEYGLQCVHHLNGQYAFALWDQVQRCLILGRDRLGICPLYYAEAHGRFFFGSEIKALLAVADSLRQLDVVALAQVFTTWAPVPPRTMFDGIRSLRPGHLMIVDASRLDQYEYWRPSFADEDAPVGDTCEAVDNLRSLLTDATRLRLRADVPVGAYLSGGLDSSTIASLAHPLSGETLQTFGVVFGDAEFDERAHQGQVASFLGTRHHQVECDASSIARVLPDVVWHAETPLLRTAPAPLFLLSERVHQEGIKTVLTGEGADEFLVGYDIFKETKVRAFWARQPDSTLRPKLFRRLYPYLPELGRVSPAYIAAFFRVGLDHPEARDFGHMVRWNGRLAERYLVPALSEAASAATAEDLDRLIDADLYRKDAVARAQHAEVATFLDPYLLASQGDRMAMAHAVELRFPFLDHRVIELCNALPSRLKMPGLREKALLKRAVADILPYSVLRRPKQPYRAPVQSVVRRLAETSDVRDALAPRQVAAEGLFRDAAVSKVLERARSDSHLGETDAMAAIGLVSFVLFKRLFWDEFAARSQCTPGRVSILADHRMKPARRH